MKFAAIIEKESDLVDIMSSYLEDYGYKVKSLGNVEPCDFDKDLDGTEVLIIDWPSIEYRIDEWLPKIKSIADTRIGVWTYTKIEDLPSSPQIFKHQISLVKPFSMETLISFIVRSSTQRTEQD